ncbi:protein MAIN-LIKE 1-like [Arachis stenosperma]|uniref:protein MAIN-LIKE 1-like n=1 Tax=Arachis stenosperma TaxID=217475 RepID=UPI0025AC99D3|nr:protein MAIN-LIKE 1-like [Arachis stenosperma]
MHAYLVYNVNEIRPVYAYKRKSFTASFRAPNHTVMAGQAGNDGDINWLNEMSHYAGASDFDRPRLLLPRRVSHTLPPLGAIVPYLAKARFSDTVLLRDFTLDNSLISALVERWRPETHMFHLLWSEVTITLQDMVYHLDLRVHGNPVGECFRDFGRWYHTETWAMVEQLLGARPLVAAQQAAQRKESFTLKLVWLREYVR